MKTCNVSGDGKPGQDQIKRLKKIISKIPDDDVVTVCGGEGESCPFFPGGKTYIHKSFEDPSAVNGTDHEKTDAFRKIRDEIKGWIKVTFLKGE